MSDNDIISANEVPDQNGSGDVVSERQELSFNLSGTFPGNTSDSNDGTGSEQIESCDQVVVSSEENALIIMCGLCGSQISEGPTMPSITVDEGITVAERHRSEKYGDKHDSPITQSEGVDDQRSS